MFSMWFRFVVQSTLLGFEAQRVVTLRMIAMSAGSSRAQAEAQRMISEKLFASFWGAAMLAAGRPPAAVVRHYRSRVRENERRLSRS